MEASDEIQADRAHGFWRFGISIFLSIPLLNIIAFGFFVLQAAIHIFIKSENPGKDFIDLIIFISAWVGAGFLAFLIAGDDIGTFTVSYTHLDVYKRQGLGKRGS